MFIVTNPSANNIPVGQQCFVFVFYTRIMNIERCYQRQDMQDKQNWAVLQISGKMKGSIES